jgi:hypothetical protein
MITPSVICRQCGANISRGYRCSCQNIDIQSSKISDSDLIAPARAVLDAVRRAFDNPEVAADYERWLVEYRARAM